MTGDLLHRLEGVAKHRCPIAFSPNGVYFSCPSADRSIMLYNLETRESPSMFKGLVNQVLAMAFSGDIMSLASSSEASGMLWDVETARLTGTSPTYNDEPMSFSSDGT